MPLAAPPAQPLLTLAGLLAYPTVQVAAAAGIELERLENTYVRLFGNDREGVQAPPYAGCYLDEADRLQFMMRFSGFCRQRGVVLDSSEPPDYIPMMLEVLALLCSRGDERVRSGPLDVCYSTWPAAFSTAVRRHDDTGFYAMVAEEADGLLQGMVPEGGLMQPDQKAK